MDVRTRRDHDTLRLLGILRHGTHDQSSHGRKGPKAAVKAAAVKVAKKVVDGVDTPAVSKPKAVKKPRAPKKSTSPVKSRSPGRVRGRDITGDVDLNSLASVLDRTPAGGDDQALVEIRRAQGFDGLPDVVSKADFDRAVSAGDVVETWRGVNGGKANEYAEAFRSGDLHPGWGVYGNGTYVANDREQAELAAGRFEPGSTEGALLRIGLTSDANVISIEMLRAEMKAYDRKNASRMVEAEELDRQMLKAAERVDTTEERIAVYAEFNARKNEILGPEWRVSRDAGRFAALRGYDAIDVPNGQGGAQMVILNRTAVIVEES